MLECLKCRTCKKFIHANCTHLPVYAIVNFLNTRSQYTCEGCVRQQLGEQDDRQFALVYTLLDREKESDQSNKDNDKENTTAQDGECDVEPNLEVPSDISPTTNNINLQKDERKNKICYFYKNNQCKFGRKGQDCPFAHPNLCNRYKFNGRDPVKGCKHGNKCKYLHPLICNGSERKRECLNLECKRLHLKGTRRYPSDQSQEQQQTTIYPPLPTRSTIPASNPHTHNEWSNRPQGPQQTQDKQMNQPQNDHTVHFLVQQMQQMQQVQQQILQALKIHPTQTTQCQWNIPPPQRLL